MGKAIVAGGKVGMEVPSAGILASDLAVGSTVKLMENGVATEYLVVNQGIPSDSSLYDSSCDGTWLLRKNVCTSLTWSSNGLNMYSIGTINSYLNSTFLSLFDNDTKNAIKQVKIPYVNGYGSSGSIDTGENGLEVYAFVLSGYEIGFTASKIPVDGVCLEYFVGATNSVRIAYDNSGSTSYWWTRSPINQGTGAACAVSPAGALVDTSVSGTLGVRPTVILPSNALFDQNTLTLKGVS